MQPYSQTTTRDEVLILAGLLGLAGIGALLLNGSSGSGGGANTSSPCAPQGAPASLGNPHAVDQPAPNAHVPLTRGQQFFLHELSTTYTETFAIDVYTYAQITQNGVTVYGSGVAGVAVGPISQPDPCMGDINQMYNTALVSPCQPQIGGGVGNYLSLQPWEPATGPSNGLTPPICGRAAVVGPADLEILIYGNQAETGNPADGGIGAAAGFGSPTCNGRKCIRKIIVPNAINFV